jgi:outer membrane protein assembly factor BamD (BamD/ComL family)
MRKFFIVALLLSSITVSVLLTRCNLNNSSKIPEWGEVKEIMKKGVSISIEDLKKISGDIYYQVNPDEINEIIDIYNSSNNTDIRIKILNTLNQNLSNLKESRNYQKILTFYQDIAKSNDNILSPIALEGLVDAEGGSNSERWQDWAWSKEVVILLEEAVNKNLNNLSNFGDLELLALANKYPDSLFTRACKEYAEFTGGTYFGDGDVGFRLPFDPQREIGFWKNFVKKYPGHPGSNDALYRLARAYEIQGDYENAIAYYYESSEAPDGLLINVARDRILFIIDLLMSSESLGKFLTNHPNHPLTPYVKYSKAVHLIREYKYSFAESELNNFLNNYQDGKYLHLAGYSYGDERYLGSIFWTKVREQLDQVKNLAKIRNQQSSDKNLYEEAKLWIDKDKVDDGFTAYNYLWRRRLRSTFQYFVPEIWEGNTTYVNKLLTADLINNTTHNYESQISYLKSIRLFEQLIKQYPQSELVEKAKYSIALNYYYLWGREYPILSDNVTSWKDIAIQSFEEFIKEFPNSSMADNASHAIKYIKSVNSNRN